LGPALALWCMLAGFSEPVPDGAGAPRSAPAFFRRKVVTRDGVPLALYRHVPSGGGSRRPPVLLVPELGMGKDTFDLEGEGLAPFLAERGREVFVVELRGQGQSAAPRGWRLRELVSDDLPAVLEVIRALRPGPVDVVAHGFSGSLVLAASVRELQGSIGKVVALSTPVEPEVPNELTATLLRQGGKFSLLAANPEGAKAFALLFALGGNFRPSRLAALRSQATDLGKAASADLLGWMESGDLALADGSTVRSRLTQYDRPTLLVVPLRDNFAHGEFATPLRDVSRAKVSSRVLTRLELMAEDYSHLSMLHGTGARADVFAPALAFLDAPALDPAADAGTLGAPGGGERR